MVQYAAPREVERLRPRSASWYPVRRTPTVANLSHGAGMKMLNVRQGGVTSDARRARRDRVHLLCICALTVSLFGSSSLLHAQAGTTRPAAKDTSMRPFKVNVSDAALADLRRRIQTTRWPDKEPVGDDSQCVPLAMLQELSRYWATGYTWRRVEAKLNALPMFKTNI